VFGNVDWVTDREDQLVQYISRLKNGRRLTLEHLDINDLRFNKELINRGWVALFQGVLEYLREE